MQRMQRVQLQAIDPLNSEMVVVCPVDVPDSRSVLVPLTDLCDDLEHGFMLYVPCATWELNYSLLYDNTHPQPSTMGKAQHCN